MEERGFASYWFYQVDTYDALTIIALAGQHTHSIDFGVGVVPTYPRHPATLAQQAATVNSLAEGRLTLGWAPRIAGRSSRVSAFPTRARPDTPGST